MENPRLADALAEMEASLGPENVITDSARLEKEADNTIGLARRLAAVVRPSTVDEVARLVATANRHLIPLYPVSCGKNLGYGQKAPVMDGQVLVDLKRMNKIRKFDDIHGSVTVEPGVTQQQLFEFLKKNTDRFWMDATGAGVDSSVVGNSLEGGFGHTPKGNHRETARNLEIVLGNGTLLKTGIFPGLGPDMTGLFVQSNFGIITAMDVELMPVPEKYVSFLVKVQRDEDLELLIDAISRLRAQNILTSLVHIANAVRSFISTRTCPPEYSDRQITCSSAQQMMSTPFMKVGYWSAIGGLYGTGAEVRAKKRELRRALRGFGGVMFFTDAKLRFLEKLAGSWLAGLLGIRENISSSLRTFIPIHGMMKGIPSDEPLRNIHWRVDRDEDMGLIWYAPTIAAKGSEMRRVAKIAEELYAAHGFELPLTATLVRPDRVVGVFSISFNRNDAEQKERAYMLYDHLKERFHDEGIFPYRSGIRGMDKIKYHDEGKAETLKLLKNALDPNGIIAPGRYAI